MQTCPRCGQADVDGSHQCASPVTQVERHDESATGPHGAIVALVILVLSFGLFGATFAFTVLHQPTHDAPVVIQTTLPTNDATSISNGQGTTSPPSSDAPTTTPATPSGGGNGVAGRQPTPTPKALSPATPLPPTAVPPTLVATPQPTPTRLPQ